MASDTLSAVLEKKIRHLCLNDFPCGNGRWRKTKDGAETAKAQMSTDELLDLLSCPYSPWWNNESWSPQASALRELAVLTPERLHTDFIYNYFTSLRIMDNGVSIIDRGLLRFSKLEELVLSVNKISEIPGKNLPRALKILELRANQLSSLNSLTRPPPPQLQYLSLGSNNLGSSEDVSHLTGKYWPQLVCLDLSDCEFQDQQALLDALSTLPLLKTLVLEGNPFTLAPSYPGFAVDSLPRLFCLDASWISPEERCNFRGLAKMRDLIVDMTSATVSVGRIRGIPDPSMSVDEKCLDFPVVTLTYFITYEFLSHQTPVNSALNNETRADTASTSHVTDDSLSDTDLHSIKICERQTAKPHTEETPHHAAHGKKTRLHSTSKLAWSECMDFSEAHTHIVGPLGCLKKFFNQGLCVSLEEEKVLSWPAASEDTSAQHSKSVKVNKGQKEKEAPAKSASARDKAKDKIRKSAPELVQDPPIRRVLGSAHVPLHSLVKGGLKVDALCDFGIMQTRDAVEAEQTFQKDLGKKTKDDKKEEKNKESKRRGGSGTGQKNRASSKGKQKGRKEHEVDVHTDNTSVQLEPVTVELNVELEKWQSASEAHKLLL
ncbi:leucine-rich repeat-containing protein 43-like [Parambassis ranga]|uniref:Leucine-rich repeat-containing protein 43-like n=1 Tax=Parambassis ranga TaxID=210632 RepID=A0A6P7J2J7_9TELE|nr:leucine-rich repeat-containing protein 43 [Parambassis ranga]